MALTPARLLVLACVTVGCASLAPAPREPSPRDAPAIVVSVTPPPAARAAAPVQAHEPVPEPEPHASLLEPAAARLLAPEHFQVGFETTRGRFVVSITRSLAPIGADRFYNLVRLGFYDEAVFFRAIQGFIVQFGLHADPDVSAAWRTAVIPDDPVVQSNVRGTLSFAMAGPGSRTTQLFVNLVDNSRLDSLGFAAMGEVIEGMDVVDSLYTGYGEKPAQGRIQSEGNEYLRHDFPLLDAIRRARLE